MLFMHHSLNEMCHEFYCSVIEAALLLCCFLPKSYLLRQYADPTLWRIVHFGGKPFRTRPHERIVVSTKCDLASLGPFSLTCSVQDKSRKFHLRIVSQTFLNEQILVAMGSSANLTKLVNKTCQASNSEERLKKYEKIFRYCDEIVPTLTLFPAASTTSSFSPLPRTSTTSFVLCLRTHS